jgi:hypothetical protein
MHIANTGGKYLLDHDADVVKGMALVEIANWVKRNSPIITDMCVCDHDPDQCIYHARPMDRRNDGVRTIAGIAARMYAEWLSGTRNIECVVICEGTIVNPFLHVGSGEELRFKYVSKCMSGVMINDRLYYGSDNNIDTMDTRAMARDCTGAIKSMTPGGLMIRNTGIDVLIDAVMQSIPGDFEYVEDFSQLRGAYNRRLLTSCILYLRLQTPSYVARCIFDWL